MHLLHSQSEIDNSSKYLFLCKIAELSTNADTILFYSEQAISLADESGINPAQALVFRGIGLLQKGNSVLALECFTEAAENYSSPRINSGIATVYLYMASTFFSQKNYNNFKNYTKKAIELYRIESDSVRLASAMHNLGFGYYQIQQYDSALILFSHTKELYQKLNNKQGIAYCIGNSGLVFSKLNKLNEAEVNLLEAIKILTEFGDETAVAEFINEYAYVLQREGKNRDAISAAHKSLGLAVTNNITEIKRDAAYRLAQIYEQISIYDSALHYQQQYYTFNDSIRNLETIQKIADQRTKFEVSQKQIEVDVLEKNKTIQRMIIGGLAIIVLLVAGLSLMIYLSLKRNRKLTRALETQKIQLEVQSKELQELNHIKDRFFSIISHDLRSPIASLGGISYLIKEGQKSNNKAILKQATDYIDQTVVSLTGLLENLLNWALSQQGKFPFKEERIDLKEMIEEVVRIFASVALSKNQTIDLDLASNLVVSADKNTMMTVIRNLLSNATKFTEKNGRIRIKLHKNFNSDAEIIVSDEGIGIPEEKLDDIFKLKEDKSSRGTDNEKGLGLGLNLVHEFVTTNKGTIRVESSLGEGTSFFLNFPLQLS
jgi:two-component system, NtrC family, sensor kinase